MSVAGRLRSIKETLPEHVRLVAVSKFHPASMIQEAYEAGQRIFGESKVQEVTAKYEQLPKDIEWHFIGHLQTNKVKYICPFIHTIHSVDSIKLLTEINRQAGLFGRTVDVLLQIHIAREETKFGFSPEECEQLLRTIDSSQYPHVRIVGLMGMATYTDDQEQIRSEFAGLNAFFLSLKERFFPNSPTFKELSIGMSDDYRIAVEQGSTQVRIGSFIFGERV